MHTYIIYISVDFDHCYRVILTFQNISSLQLFSGRPLTESPAEKDEKNVLNHTVPRWRGWGRSWGDAQSVSVLCVQPDSYYSASGCKTPGFRARLLNKHQIMRRWWDSSEWEGALHMSSCCLLWFLNRQARAECALLHALFVSSL